jgi:hypothetical protein
VLLVTATCYRRIAVIILFSGLLTLYAGSALFRDVSATIVWADDFGDGNFDGWTVNLGVFSASDNILRASGFVLNAISHPSSIATGTWRIDLYFSSIPHYSSIYMFVKDIGQGIGNNGYWLYITTWRVTLHLETEFVTDPIANFSFPKPLHGWQHFDITRDSTGLIRTYINGTLCMETTDTNHNTANYFLVQLRDGDAIDNVEVSSTIDVEPQPSNLSGQLLLVLGVLSAVLVATLVISLILVFSFRRVYRTSEC